MVCEALKIKTTKGAQEVQGSMSDQKRHNNKTAKGNIMRLFKQPLPPPKQLTVNAAGTRNVLDAVQYYEN
jgi:hypothetical protein